MKQPLKAVDALLQTIEKQFGKGAMMRLGDGKAERVPCIPTGSPSLDEALGCGGYPKGRVVEVFGPESSGKTTLTLHAIAQCQAMGGVAAFIDAEHALDIYYAKNLGVQANELLVSQPSVAALVPKAELEGDMGDSHMGLQARLMSQALRKLSGAAHRTGTTIVFINQLRMKIGVIFGSPETTTGGHALKYYASVRLDIRRIGAVKQGDEILGNRTRVKVVKNKLAPPFRKAEFDIRYGKGIDAVGDLLDRAVQADAVEKSGSYYRFGGKNIAQGRENMRAAMEKDGKLQEAIAARLQPPAKGAQKAA
jgi:recombination protein RecA